MPQEPPLIPPIVKEEQDLLDRTQALLAEHPYDLPPSEHETVTELVRIRDEIQSAKEEDKPALLQQYEHMYAALSQMRATKDRPQLDPASPYFAHLRIREYGKRPGDHKERDLFLGKATRIDGGLRIVDWRNAPISRVFYTCKQGDEFEEEVAERTIEGKLMVRRTVTIRRAVLERVDAPEGIYSQNDDGSWGIRTIDRPQLLGGQQASATRLHDVGSGSERRLGTSASGVAQRADKRLPDIAGLIDPEQFDLITKPSTGFLVIRGTAGSGKTTVALHRIAWLAFNDPKIDSRDTLFLVFSRALRDYVGRVLPSLGIHKVHAQTFPDWVREQRLRHLPRLPRKIRDDTPEIVIRLKLHPATMVALEQLIESTDHPATAEQAVDDWATVLTEIDVIQPTIEKLAKDAFTPEELQRAVSWCRDRHDELLAWLDHEPESVGELDQEDDALLVRAFQKRVGPLRRQDGFGPIRYRHICIDEVQDFSPVEVRILIDCLDASQSITLSGDTQQHVMTHAGFTSWSTFFSWLGVPGTAVETLKVAYRSSRPIVRFALDVLGDLREDGTPPMTVRDGPPVEVFPFTDHGAVVAFLADTLTHLVREEPLANVAVITPSQSMAEMYEAGLRSADVPHLRRVIDEGFSFQPGVEIVEVSQVKGLEFDYVVIIEASANAYPDTPNARRLLHVASTRAIHQLWITSVATVSPIVREALGHVAGDTA